MPVNKQVFSFQAPFLSLTGFSSCSNVLYGYEKHTKFHIRVYIKPADQHADHTFFRLQCCVCRDGHHGWRQPLLLRLLLHHARKYGHGFKRFGPKQCRWRLFKSGNTAVPCQILWCKRSSLFRNHPYQSFFWRRRFTSLADNGRCPGFRSGPCFRAWNPDGSSTAIRAHLSHNLHIPLLKPLSASF